MHSARKYRVTPCTPRVTTTSTPRPQGMSDADWLLQLSIERVLAMQRVERPDTGLSSGVPTGTETFAALDVPHVALGGSQSSREPSDGGGSSCSSAEHQESSAAPVDDMERLLHASTQRILCMSLESARQLHETAAAEPERSGGDSSTPRHRMGGVERLPRHRILAAAQAGGSFLRSPRPFGSLHSPRPKMQPPPPPPPPLQSPSRTAEAREPQPPAPASEWTHLALSSCAVRECACH